MKSDGSADSGLAAPSTASASPTLEVVVSTAEKHPDTDEGGNLRKRSRGQLPTRSRKSPSGGTYRDLCEVEDKAGANGYFASIMMQSSPGEGKEPLKLRWSSIPRLARVWIEGLLAGEYLRGALHPVLAKQLYECSSEELMNRASKSTI
ncbi:hypothetical protein B296_00054946 [Ensete ventricosum]|uniref:Uncharacterized protein n=1 Tax=Ensete ventricosum TaxID=4639 RepID=A0A426WYM7_ENSVE|nr:hypothetical protein B296_00054946 [Ensete ventricosum]